MYFSFPPAGSLFQVKNAHDILGITCPKDESPSQLPFLFTYSIITLDRKVAFTLVLQNRQKTNH
jgi:hypothetical protein